MGIACTSTCVAIKKAKKVRVNFTIPPGLIESWKKSTDPNGADPIPRKKYQYGMTSALENSGIVVGSFRLMYKWMVTKVKADTWMKQLRGAGPVFNTGVLYLYSNSAYCIKTFKFN